MQKQVEKLENFISEIAQAINPCNLCENKTDIYAEACSICCYFYASHFEAKKEIKRQKKGGINDTV
jgi:hypothetical protein